MTQILAIDPGKTTGFAIAREKDAKLEIAYGQNTFDHARFYNLLRRIQPDILICESFEYRKGKYQPGVELYPLELIGIVHLYSQIYNDSTDLILQGAFAQGKTMYWSDAQLKRRDLYIRGLEHGRSAVKHLLYWYSRKHGYEINAELVDLEWLIGKLKVSPFPEPTMQELR